LIAAFNVIVFDFDNPNILQVYVTINTLLSIYWKTSRKKYNQRGISLGIGFSYIGLINN